MVPLPVRRGSRCLEVGGGRGEFAAALRSKGYDVALADLSESNVRHARESGFDGHRLDLNDGLPVFDTASFDVVVMLEVIEHIVRAEHLLEEAFRVLRLPGVLILSTPNFAWFRERLRVAMGKPPEAEGYHYRFFTVDTVRHLITSRGFRIMQEKYSMPAFGLNLARRKLLKDPLRRHLIIPRSAAGLLAQTMFVRAEKM